MERSFWSSVEGLMEEYDMCPTGATVLCAVSGGADSMCLLHLLHTLGRQRGFAVCAAHFDHRIRPTSPADAAFVRSWCKEHDVPFFLGSADVPAEAKARGLGLEETGRLLRYAFLERTAEQAGAARIATAHHGDDNLETLLLHLTRGAGLRGLSGIPPRRGSIVRPLLEVSRAEVLTYLNEYGVPHVEDESNADCSAARNRIRHQVLPVLRELNPDLTAAAVRAQRSLRQDEVFLSARAMRAVSAARTLEDGVMVYASALAGLPEAVAMRAVGQLLALAKAGDGRCGAVHRRAVLALCRGSDPSAAAALPGGWEARRSYDHLILRPVEEKRPSCPPAVLPVEGDVLWGDGWRITCQQAVCPLALQKNPAVFHLDRDKIAGDVQVRGRSTGDRLALAGRPGSKSVKKWMIECRLPRTLRDKLPVLADERGVVAVTGLGVDERCAAEPGSACWKVTVQTR